MTGTSLRGLSFFLAALVAGALGVGPAFAQDDADLLKEARQRKEIETQKKESEVRQAIKDAAKLAKTQPAKAVEKLKALLTQLDEDTVLEKDKRDSFKRVVKYDLRAYGAEVRGDDGLALKAAQANARRAEADRQRDEQERISRTYQDIRNLRNAGRADEANRLASELERKYPDLAGAQASRQIGSLADRLADLRRAQAENGSRTVGVHRDIDRSATAPLGDYELPRDWYEKTQRRSKDKLMTATERAILKALNSPISVDFKSTAFSGVIDYLQKALGQPIIVDKQAMDEANVTYDSPLTLQVTRVSARTVLKKVLGDLGLAYVIKDQTLQVTTPARAKEMLTTRTYYVGDLAPSFDLRFGPDFNRFQALQTIGQIIEMIQSNIEPQSWRANNGPGTIAFDPITMSLVIRQSAEVHFMLGVGLR